MEPSLSRLKAAQEDEFFQYFLAQSFGGCRQILDAQGQKVLAYFWRGNIYLKGFEPPKEPA